ncbi:MAG TPA: beta-N-acetylhexosaminidase [Anaerolineae bacterium]|nr:beta-N-acetylhexosaminidase [Anaerolineae bacterium]
MPQEEHSQRHRAEQLATLLLCLLILIACQAPQPTETPTPAPTITATPIAPSTPTQQPEPTQAPRSITTMDNLIPKPVSIKSTGGTFMLTASTQIAIDPNSAEVTQIGQYLADALKPATGYGLQVSTASSPLANGNILLTTVTGDPTLGEEGYELTITTDSIKLIAYRSAGLFRGIQTLRQLLPASIENAAIQAGPWTVPTGTITDYPRFEWRGAMLDVARHFFSVDDVKRYIDLLAYTKINRLHLHLTDDQGWRIMINAWPKLATLGGSTEVGGGAGGYYTQADYAEIVAYAQSRYMLVIPEIDLPGHTNAALASYAELNCDGIAPKLYTGTEVGFSSLCGDKEITYQFLDDVIKELAAMTPGPYIHIGGDEAKATAPEEYKKFIERVQAIVQAHGKQMIGWEEIASTQLLTTSIAQHWTSNLVRQAVQRGAKVIMSPATKSYLDMKYDASTPLGQDWAAYIEVRDSYTWVPTTLVDGVTDSDILGVEAPLWSETLTTIKDIEFMAFPRMLSIAEIGWSAASRDWDEYKVRLAAHGPRLTNMSVNFYRSPQVPWQ